MKPFTVVDLFCGAGGTSTGATAALQCLGRPVELTAVNHWDVAIATHSANHPAARHLCTYIDNLNPRQLYAEGELDLLLASPECTHHSNAAGGRPRDDQSRSTAWCVVRWLDALLPKRFCVENVPEFANWGPLNKAGMPIPSQRGQIFRSWIKALRALGYRVEYRELCAANYGDPTTRLRLFVQGVRGRGPIVWPDPTHTREPDLYGGHRWRSAREIIDWDLPMRSIFNRPRPLAANTLRRIDQGLRKYGSRGQTAAYVLPQHSGGQLRSVAEPLPTVATSGAISLILEYYGNGVARPVDDPLPTVTCNDRFALIQAAGGDVQIRMLTPAELAAAQGFPAHYQFHGNRTERVKQIGNAVPCNLARAIILAAISQSNDIRPYLAEGVAA